MIQWKTQTPSHSNTRYYPSLQLNNQNSTQVKRLGYFGVQTIVLKILFKTVIFALDKFTEV
nr:MAG TPA: hypothetical protein [Caudoviricetes sp.]